MSCSSAAMWTSSSSWRGCAGALGDRPRVAGDGGGVPRGHLVAQVERAQHRAQHPDLEAGQLLAAPRQLGGPLLGEQQLAEQVLEGDQDDAEEAIAAIPSRGR